MYYSAFNHVGSIPAYAGETRASERGGFFPRVDPRVRGGDQDLKTIPAERMGRSPRTRGRRYRRIGHNPCTRSIPAYAGETLGLHAVSVVRRVDPRVRGGDAMLAPMRVPFLGRSPRTRGRRTRLASLAIFSRSIPAYAGETAPGQILLRRIRVDPRVRGGDATDPYYWRFLEGRSPRTRGRRHARQPCLLVRRSIPAYAGETRCRRRCRSAGRVDPRVRGGDSISQPNELSPNCERASQRSVASIPSMSTNVIGGRPRVAAAWPPGLAESAQRMTIDASASFGNQSLSTRQMRSRTAGVMRGAV